MDVKKELRILMDNANESIDNLINSFKTEGREVTYLISRKNRIKNKSIFDAYLEVIGRQDEEFKEYIDKVKFEEKINIHKYKILKHYNNYIEVFDEIKEFVQNFYYENYKFNTIRRYLLSIKKYNLKILKVIEVGINSEYNDYYKNLNSIEDLLSRSRNLISIMLHILYQKDDMIKKLDYKDMKKLSLKDLEVGDIILLDEFTKYKSSLARRQIVYWIKSTILHSSIVFDINKKKDNYIIFEAAGGNRRKSYVADLELLEGVRYLVLKPRKKFSKEEKMFLQQKILDNTNLDFSILKLYGIAFNYAFTNLYKRWIPLLTEGKNVYFGKGIFCSESIAVLYSSVNRNISNNEDFGMISPIDILNSYELEIAGYFEKEK